MRKFVTVLMMIAMLSMPNNMALAVKSGSGSGSGEGKGGFDANVTLEQAMARPAFFVSIALIQVFSATNLFLPSGLFGKQDRRTLISLLATGGQTVDFFLSALSEYVRYFVYYFLFTNPYFAENDSTNSQQTAPKDDVYSVAVPEISTVFRRASDTKPPPFVTKKQRAINAAVERALRDPELAKKYLEFASPDVRHAVQNALNNQFSDEDQSRFNIIEGREGDYGALLSELMERK